MRGEAGLGRATGSEVPPGSPRALLGGREPRSRRAAAGEEGGGRLQEMVAALESSPGAPRARFAEHKGRGQRWLWSCVAAWTWRCWVKSCPLRGSLAVTESGLQFPSSSGA